MRTIKLAKETKLWMDPWIPKGFQDTRPFISLPAGSKVKYSVETTEHVRIHKIEICHEGHRYSTFSHKYRCPHCQSYNTEYRGSYAAPGYGNAHDCLTCHDSFAEYGGRSEESPRILDPEDVI